MKTLVTGASGVVGRQLLADLHDTDQVRSFGRSAVAPEGSWAEHAAGDVRDFSAVRAAMRGVDRVVHLAGLLEDQDPLETFEVDLRGTYHVLEAARLEGVDRVVFASSIAVTGCLAPSFVPDAVPILETDACRPASAYAAAKLASEDLCDMYARRYGITTVTLRIAGVQQPETWQEPLWEHERSPILWAWISVKDLSRALRSALESSAPGGLIVTVTAADTCSLRATRELVQGFCPGAVIRGHPERDASSERWPLFSIEAARRSLGWTPIDRFDTTFGSRERTRGPGGVATP